MSMLANTYLDEDDDAQSLTPLEAWLLTRDAPTYGPYYNGKMSYALHGDAWKVYVQEAFPELNKQNTSENIYKSALDLYAENLVPLPKELRGFSNVLVPLLSRGEALVIVDSAGEAHFPEHFEMISDGRFTAAVVYTRSIEKMEDYATFVYSDGRSRLFYKAVPDDMTSADAEGYIFREDTTGNDLFRFALDDKGFGPSLQALQDRVNHSIIDQTVIAEMYARPFWYLMNVQLPPVNPYLPATQQAVEEALKEQPSKGIGGRVFTTSSEGPFGQLEPPTIGDMIQYHDSIYDKVSSQTGIPQHYFKPGSGTPPTGVALKVLSKRFNNKVSRMREDIEPTLEELATLLGVEKTGKDEDGEPAYEFWNTSDDLLQESLDAHGISLSTMGYPLEYIASVVTPGVDLSEYQEDEGLPADGDPADPNEPVDMTAMGQTGTPATPGQVEAYRRSPGQRKKGQ